VKKIRIDKEWKAIGALVGATIGAGIFGLPYVFSRFGFLPSTLYLFFLGGLTLVLNLAYGEIILRTPGDHQIIGYTGIYLKKRAHIVSIISNIALFVSIYGALLAYGIKIGEFGQMIFGSGNPTLLTILFFSVAFACLYFGLRAVSLVELIVSFLVVGLVFLFLFASLPKIDISYITGFNPYFLFLPYGVILFALNGSSVIPEIEEILRKKPEKLKKTIILGTTIPIMVYFLFAFVVVGNSGPYTSEDALSGLLPILPNWLVKTGAFLGILSMGSSFLTLGYVLREIWFRDFKMSRTISLLLSVLPPIALFLIGIRNFIRILDFSGAISVGLTGILLLLAHQNAKKQGKRDPAYVLNIPRPIVFFICGFLILGLVSPFLIKIY